MCGKVKNYTKSLQDGPPAHGSCGPVRASPGTEVHKPVAACEYIVVSRRERKLVLRFLATDDTDDARVDPVVPPGETRSTRIPKVKVAVLGFKLLAAVAVTIGVVVCETLLECWLLGIVYIAGIADVAPYRQIVPIARVAVVAKVAERGP